MKLDKYPQSTDRYIGISQSLTLILVYQILFRTYKRVTIASNAFNLAKNRRGYLLPYIVNILRLN